MCENDEWADSRFGLKFSQLPKFVQGIAQGPQNLRTPREGVNLGAGNVSEMVDASCGFPCALRDGQLQAEVWRNRHSLFGLSET